MALKTLSTACQCVCKCRRKVAKTVPTGLCKGCFFDEHLQPSDVHLDDWVKGKQAPYVEGRVVMITTDPKSKPVTVETAEGLRYLHYDQIAK